MTTKEYIESGLLEPYVYGSLSTEEQARVAEDVTKDPELQKEVEAIEAALMKLSKATSPGLRSTIKNDISLKIKKKKALPLPK